MPNIVNVPGLGNITFPDNMPPEQMHSEVGKAMAQQGVAPGQTFPSGGPVGEQPNAQVLSPVQAAFTPFKTIAPALPTFNVTKPLDMLLGPALAHLISPTQPDTWGGPPALQGAIEGVQKNIVDPVQSPGGVATMMLPGLSPLLAKLAGAGFSAQAIANTPELARQAGTQSVTGDEKQNAENVVALLANALQAVGGAHSVSLLDKLGKQPPTDESAPQQQTQPPTQPTPRPQYRMLSEQAESLQKHPVIDITPQQEVPVQGQQKPLPDADNEQTTFPKARVAEVSGTEIANLRQRFGGNPNDEANAIHIVVKGEHFIFVDKDLPPEQKAESLAHEQRHVDLDNNTLNRGNHLQNANAIVQHVEANPNADPELHEIIQAFRRSGYTTEELGKELIAEGILKPEHLENDLSEIRQGKGKAGLRWLQERAEKKVKKQIEGYRAPNLNLGGPETALPPDQQQQSKANNSPQAWGDFGGLNTKLKEVKQNEVTQGQEQKEVLGGEQPTAQPGQQPQQKVAPSPSRPFASEDYKLDEAAQGREDFIMEAPLLLKDKSKLGMVETARPDAQQLIGRLSNLANKGELGQGELQYYKDQGLEKFVSEKKPTVGEVGKWMQENGPRVEVRKFGEGILTEQQKKSTQAEHLFDTMGYTLDRTEAGQIVGIKKDGKMVVFHELTDEAKQAFKDIDVQSRTPEVNQAHWSFVAPKAEKDMPGYTEIAVVRPMARHKFYKGETDTLEQPKFPSSHNFPPNTLAFARGYMETDPTTKEKTWHVVEVQSDWAQQQRELQKSSGEGREPRKELNDPLLAHYETLALKASITHAREQGATRIAISDAETAMMSEGHDRQGPTEQERNQREPVSEDKLIPQAKGMRLHYDRTLPSVAEKLTGEKGRMVEFGEHEKAFDYNAQNETGGGYPPNDPRGKRARPDLIFRNPDGTPKTSITARSYPLPPSKISGVEQPPTVFNKRYSPAQATPTTFAAAREVASVRTNEEATKLGLKDGTTVHEVLDNITKSKSYPQHDRALATFLNDNFEHVLRLVGVQQGEGNYFDMAAGQFGDVVLDASQHYDMALHERALHEAVHAATEYASAYPRTSTQRAAVEKLNGLLNEAVSKLPPELQKLSKETLKPLYDKITASNGSNLELYKALDDAGWSRAWFPRLYSTLSRTEMLAQAFSDKSVFAWLNQSGKKGFVYRVWDNIRSLLGVNPGSVVDRSLDIMQELGADREGNESAWTPVDRMMDSVEGKVMPGAAAKADTDVGEKRDLIELAKASYASAKGVSVPKTITANRELGNMLVRYASSKVAAPQIGQAMASGVLRDKFKDEQFNNELGMVMVQDRLDALRQQHIARGDNDLAAKVNNVISPDVMKASLAKPGIQQALNLHKKTVQLDLETMHRFLGGTIARGGEQTGAFVNLIALLDPENVDKAKEFIYGGSKGDITNPLKRGSALNKQAKGTAPDYETSYRTMVERAYRANYEEFTKQQLYKEYVKSGLGVEEKPGVKPPTFSGQSAAKIAIDRRGGQARNLWIRKDLAGELHQALQTDFPVEKDAVVHLADLATELQVMGPTDAVLHLGQMLAAIKWSQGGARTAIGDAARKIPFYTMADTAGRLMKAAREVINNDPSIQRELAELAKIGAGRAEARHEGLLTKTLTKYGVDENLAKKFDPTNYQGRFIKFMDKVGRITMNRMFDNLVERGWIKETEGVSNEDNRREFINRMGQYNERLMTKNMQWMRSKGFSPFVVAGRNFNRLALQRLLQSPGFEAASPEVAAKARIIEALGTLGVMFALPIAWNLAHTGQAFPNGIPNAGAMALKKDEKTGKWTYFDLLQNNLERRALRISGASAIETGMRQGDSPSKLGISAAKAIVEGQLNPWEGPALKAAKVLADGKDFSGFLVSRNPENTVENLKAALMNLNPTVATMFGGEDKGIGKTVSRLAQVGGVKEGPQPSFEARANDAAQKSYGKAYEDLSLGQQASVARQIQAETPPRNELTERAAGEKAYWGGVQRKDDVASDLSYDVSSWIKKNNLQLPGFEDVKTVDKERVPLTNKERQVFEGVVAQKYNEFAQRLMSNGEDFTSRPQQAKQLVFNKVMVQARRAAWGEYLRSKQQP